MKTHLITIHVFMNSLSQMSVKQWPFWALKQKQCKFKNKFSDKHAQTISGCWFKREQNWPEVRPCRIVLLKVAYYAPSSAQNLAKLC